MHTIRAVLFDLDGTLHDREISIKSFISDQFIRFRGYFNSSVSKDQFVKRFVELDNRGLSRKREVYKTVVSEFSVEGLSDEGQNLIAQELLADYDKCSPNYYVGVDELHETLTTLRKERYRLGIVSNGRESVQQEKIDRLKIRGYFDAIVISESVGVKKPHPAIFHKALEALKVTPEEAIFVGDNPKVDIEGAKKVGMKTFWKKDDCRILTPGDEKIIEECADRTITNLGSLSSMIHFLWVTLSGNPDPLLSVAGIASGLSEGVTSEEIDRVVYGYGVVGEDD